MHKAYEEKISATEIRNERKNNTKKYETKNFILFCTFIGRYRLVNENNVINQNFNGKACAKFIEK